MRILIVEDDPVLRDGLKVGLSLGGFAADAVETCAEADAALSANDFDALVLDLMLPDGSGLDILKALRGRQDRIPVLLLTARDGSGWLAPLARRNFFDAPQQNCGR